MIDAGRVDNPPPIQPPATLLTRRAVEPDLPGAAALLATAGLPVEASRRAAESRLLFVLDEVACAPSEPPLAALAARVDPHSRDGRIIGFVVAPSCRGRGFGRRLLTDVITLLRAEGVASLSAAVDAGTPADALLGSLGFTVATLGDLAREL